MRCTARTNYCIFNPSPQANSHLNSDEWASNAKKHKPKPCRSWRGAAGM